MDSNKICRVGVDFPLKDMSLVDDLNKLFNKAVGLIDVTVIRHETLEVARMSLSAIVHEEEENDPYNACVRRGKVRSYKPLWDYEEYYLDDDGYTKKPDSDGGDNVFDTETWLEIEDIFGVKRCLLEPQKCQEQIESVLEGVIKSADIEPQLKGRLLIAYTDLLAKCVTISKVEEAIKLNDFKDYLDDIRERVVFSIFPSGFYIRKIEDVLDTIDDDGRFEVKVMFNLHDMYINTLVRIDDYDIDAKAIELASLLEFLKVFTKILDVEVGGEAVSGGDYQ